MADVDNTFLQAGDHLKKRYQIGKEIGRGGFSVVYEAIDMKVGNPVAIKLLVPPPASADVARERMRREVLAARSLTHPNIVSIFDLHEEGPWTFVIMQLIKGDNIADQMDEDARRRRAGGIGEKIAMIIEQKTGYDTRVSVLGHIQRGGTPTAYDRILGTQFGIKAVELVKEGKFGQMVSVHNNKLGSVPLKKAVEKRKTIDMELYEVAKVFFAS